MFDSGILWINSRNLQYIKTFNPKKVIRLADNKQKTKNFLKERWIPVAETYWVISDRAELYNFDFGQMPSKHFVVKPNKWSKWKWIYIAELIENTQWWNIVDIKMPNYFQKLFGFGLKSKYNYKYKLWNKIISDDEFRRYLLDILDGKYSMTLWQDKIIVEEKLKPWINFKRYCRHWLADIRVIVFNLIPVAAMLRVPTQWSSWTANISQGGIWLWIEVWSGKIKSMYFKKKIFTKSFPWEYKDLYNKKMPLWNDILLYSSKIQYFVNLGYLALDWVITPQWPKLLEINARAGLEVQSASKLRLKKRLEKISDINVQDPEKWVEISKSIFNSSKTSFIAKSKVLYLSQRWSLIFEWQDWDSVENVTIKIDLKKEKNYAWKKLYNKIQNFERWDIITDIPESEIRFKNLSFQCSEKIKPNEIILGQWPINEYYIKPIHKTQPDIHIINSKNIKEEELEQLQTIDQNLSKIWRKLNFTKILKPINYLDELDNFITWNGNYNPKFIYSWPEDKYLNDLKSQLSLIKEKHFSEGTLLQSNFASLLEEKTNELLNKLNLIKAYKWWKYQNILKYNERLFGNIDEQLIKSCKEKIFLENYDDEEILWKKLTFSQVKKIIKKHLEEKWISWVKINTNMWVSRISIIRWKNPQIRTSPAARFRENELLATLAHEIDIHLVRFLNWKKSGWEILKSWTAWYIKDEEWLAIYNSMKHLPKEYDRKTIYEKYYLIDMAQKHSFSRLVDIIKWIKPRTLSWAFNTAFRLKKWIWNTWFVDKWAIYMKEKIYLDWYNKIVNRIEEWWDTNKLMIGKIKIEDIDKIY